MPNTADSTIRTGNRSLQGSRINRNGLSPGTAAPVFSLPRLGGGKFSLEACRGRRLLLVFSDPNCLPCNQLAPLLQKTYSKGIEIVMISRGDYELNQTKAVEHGLTFPIVIQRSWELSRQYGIFATPVGYLIDENGIITANVATGFDAIAALATKIQQTVRERMQARVVELKAEFDTGQSELEQLDKRRIYVRETMLRIAGAVQVLEELLAELQDPA